MPSNTALTASPYALLSDAANIETAGKPGFENLEKFTIPRFSSESSRNAAFALSAPSIGQLSCVNSHGHLRYEVWNGSSWEELGAHTLLREDIAVQVANQDRTGTTFANITDLVLPVATNATYKIEVCAFYGTSSNDTTIEFNFTFPGGSSRISISPLGKGPSDSVSSGENADRINVNSHHDRVSGDAALAFKGSGSLGDAVGAFLYGILETDTSGDLQVTFRRASGTDTPTVRVFSRSYLSLKRVS